MISWKYHSHPPTNIYTPPNTMSIHTTTHQNKHERLRVERSEYGQISKEALRQVGAMGRFEVHHVVTCLYVGVGDVGHGLGVCD